MNNYKVIKYDNYNIVVVSKKKNVNNLDKKKIKKGGIKDLSNLRRARRTIKEVIELNVGVGSRMITLTYAENQQCYKQAQKDFKAFLRKIKNPNYIAVKELQKRGAIHYHIIIFDYVSTKEIKSSWKHGFSYTKDILDLSNIDALMNYMSKYLSDWEKGQLIKKGQRLVQVSRKAKRRKKIDIDYEEFLEYIKKDFVSIKNHNYIKLVIPK